ncbi:MAG: hypothetical protein WCG92_11610 [Hyphomicrobiales bacterium]|nr:hypothetical protein [Alphaproteobacteria bacterium]
MTTPSMTPPSTTPRTTSQATPSERREPTQLSHRYGNIGIQAVAASARYADRRQAHAAEPRIDQRFEESAS